MEECDINFSTGFVMNTAGKDTGYQFADLQNKTGAPNFRLYDLNGCDIKLYFQIFFFLKVTVFLKVVLTQCFCI